MSKTRTKIDTFWRHVDQINKSDAGGHCNPATLPGRARFVWHKVCSSTQRHADTAKARKELPADHPAAATALHEALRNFRMSWPSWDGQAPPQL